MTEKHVFAKELVRQNCTNAVIVPAVKEKFGAGISSSVLARFRREIKEEADQSATPAEIWEFAKQHLATGMSRYECRNLAVAKFGRGPSYGTMLKIIETLPKGARQRVLNADYPKEEQAPAEAQPSAEEPVTPFELPPEVHETSPVSAPDLGGPMDSLKGVQAWMREIGAQSLTLTAEGKVSVVVQHELGIGVSP